MAELHYLLKMKFNSLHHEKSAKIYAIYQGNSNLSLQGLEIQVKWETNSCEIVIRLLYCGSKKVKNHTVRNKSSKKAEKKKTMDEDEISFKGR